MTVPTTSLATVLRPLALLCVLLALPGCFSPGYSNDTPFWCTASDQSCPDGYTCVLKGMPDPANPDHRLCQENGGSGTKPGTCRDDDLEVVPNDVPQNATSLDVALATQPVGTSLFGMEICTPEDKDYYSFTVSARKRATIVIQYARDQGELSASLLDPSLALLARGVPQGAGLQIQATVDPQPTPYFLLVEAGPGGTTNVYDFSLSFANP